MEGFCGVDHPRAFQNMDVSPQGDSVLGVTPAFLSKALGSHRTQTKKNLMLTCNPLDLVGVAKDVNEAGIWLKFGGLPKSA